MAKFSRVAGATSQSVNVFIQDSSSSTGAGLTGLAFGSSGLTCYYTHTGANCTATAVTLATLAAVNSAWSSGGFKEIDSTHTPGLYRFDLPDAVLATSKGNLVTIYLQGAASMAPCLLEIELTAWDNRDAVRGGMTALPNAAANANGGLPVLSSSGTTLGYTVTTLTTYTGNTPQTGDNYAIVNGTSGSVATKAVVDAVKAKTDNLPAAPASTTNITAGTLTTVTTATNVTTVNGLAAGVITDAAFTFPAESAGRPTTFLAAMRRVWEWAVNKKTRDRSTGTVLLRNAADDGTLETQTQSTSGTTDTQTKGV